MEDAIVPAPLSGEDSRLAMEQKSNGRAVISVIGFLGLFAFAGLGVVWNLSLQLVPAKIAVTSAHTTTISTDGFVPTTAATLSSKTMQSGTGKSETDVPGTATASDSVPAPTNATLQSVITALIALISSSVGALGAMLASTRSSPQPVMSKN